MNDIDTYLKNSATPAQSKILQHIRDLIHEAIPDVEEAMAYAMPTFRYKGKNVIHFAAFKNHMSLFPTPEPVEVLKDRLKEFKTSKGTIQFTESKLLPDDLIRELIKTSFQNIRAKVNK